MTAPSLNFGNFRENGCLVIERLFDPALIDRVRAEYDRQYVDAVSVETAPYLPVGDKRFHLPIKLTGPLLDPMFLLHPLLRATIGGLMPGTLMIDSVNVVTSFPGSPSQRVHRDHSKLFTETDAADHIPTYAMAVAIPLIDLSEETGGTRLYPGSHFVDDPKTIDPESGLLPLSRRGDCYLYDFRLLHAGLANRSAHPRPILFVTFARMWFTDTINFKRHPRIVMDRAEFEALPDETRELFGRLAT